MKRILALIGIVFAGFVLLSIITATPLVGEVVTLHTKGEAGEWQTTPLWIVDTSGGTYLRAGSPDSGWVIRMRKDPQARLKRGDEIRDVRLVPELSMRETINGLMAEKYGWADDFVGLMADRSVALPIRVQQTP